MTRMPQIIFRLVSTHSQSNHSFRRLLASVSKEVEASRNQTQIVQIATAQHLHTKVPSASSCQRRAVHGHSEAVKSRDVPSRTFLPLLRQPANGNVNKKPERNAIDSVSADVAPTPAKGPICISA